MVGPLHSLTAFLYLRGNGPAYKLLDAMQSVKEYERYDGYKGPPRLVLALLWKLQEISER